MLRPESIADAAIIADALRAGGVVIVDLTQTQEPHVQRIQDFVNGATRVRGGTVSLVGEKRYRVAPAIVNEHEREVINSVRPAAASAAPEPKEDGA